MEYRLWGGPKDGEVVERPDSKCPEFLIPQEGGFYRYQDPHCYVWCSGELSEEEGEV